MSHITKIEIKVTDLVALKAACRRLNLKFVEGQRTYKWYGRTLGEGTVPHGMTEEDLGRCDHAIQVPGAQYEIGVRGTSSHYLLLWDNWKRGGLERIIGENAGLLKQAYGLEKAKKDARRNGYTVTEKRHKNGAITLNLTNGGVI